MDYFEIRLLPTAPIPEALGSVGKCCLGHIQIGDFGEKFLARLDYWNTSDYEDHWRSAISRVLEGKSPSCLITSMPKPEPSDVLYWWPIYLVDQEAFIQNHMLLLRDIKTPFNELN